MGASINYVSDILPIFTPLPSPLRKQVYYISLFSSISIWLTPLPPRLVYGCPLMVENCVKLKMEYSIEDFIYLFFFQILILKCCTIIWKRHSQRDFEALLLKFEPYQTTFYCIQKSGSRYQRKAQVRANPRKIRKLRQI